MGPLVFAGLHGFVNGKSFHRVGQDELDVEPFAFGFYCKKMAHSGEQYGMPDGVQGERAEGGNFPVKFLKSRFYLLILVEKVRFDIGDGTAMILVGILEGPVAGRAGPHALENLISGTNEHLN